MMGHCAEPHRNSSKKLRRGVIGVTFAAADRLHVKGIGNVRRVKRAAEEPPEMKRQTRLNLNALLVAVPMVLIAVTTAISNFP